MPTKKTTSGRSEAQKKAEEKYNKKRSPRHKAWTAIIYEDSLPEGWKDELSNLHVQVWVSPVHDNDYWTAADERENKSHKAGTKKKSHRHLIIEYGTQVDRETFLNDIRVLNGSEFVKHVKRLNSLVRYLIHMDDPEKAPYKREEILTFGGANLDALEVSSLHDKHENLREMRRFIRANEITNFCDFYDYCDDCMQDWAYLLDDNSTYTIERYIHSLRNTLKMSD